jgi:hypothetical protein
MPVAPKLASMWEPPSSQPMDAGFHHKEAGPRSAASPLFARPHPLTLCS